MWLLEVEIQQGFSLSGGRPSQFYGELNLTQLLLPIVIFVLGKVKKKRMLDVVLLSTCLIESRSRSTGIFHQKQRVMAPGYLTWYLNPSSLRSCAP